MTNKEFIAGVHTLYNRYHNDWLLCQRSWHGGVEYKLGQYLRAYSNDFTRPAEVINTYTTTEDGMVLDKIKAQVNFGAAAEPSGSTFYHEKLDQTPLYNYVKLIVAEYGAILFRNPPARILPQTPELDAFIADVDGEGNSIDEFMGLVDQMTTVFGVCYVGVVLPEGASIPRLRVYTPLEVRNWRYEYTRDGNLVLKEMSIEIESTDEHSVYRYFNNQVIETWFIGEDDEYVPPIDDDGVVQVDSKTWCVSEPNPLGYIPLIPIYQNNKTFPGVGTTPIQDIAQIQRSIYSDMAEIYSAITYGAHPTLIVDKGTVAANSGCIAAEPGSVVQVEQGITGEANYVYEFVSPQLDAIDQIRELVDSKIEKLSTLAMLRSEDLIRASNSGAQVEQYDDKLSAVIRKKATNLENAEYKLFELVFDWMNQSMPTDFSVTYNRQYTKRALEQELADLKLLMDTVGALGDGPDMQEATTQIKMRLMQLISIATTNESR